MLPDSNSVQPTHPPSKAKQYHQATCDYTVRPIHQLYSCNGAIAVLRGSESLQPEPTQPVLPGPRGRKGSL